MNKSIFLKALLPICLVFAGCEQKLAKEKEEALSLTTPAITTLDSVRSTDGASFGIISNTQETLMTYDEDKPVLAAAKSYELSKDGKTYTFHLHKNMKWSDGQPLKAGDYHYAWLRVLDPKVGASYSNFLFSVVGARDYYLGKNGVKKEDIGIRLIDDYTIEVKLTHPVPYFTQIISFPVLSPQRKDLVEKYQNSYGSTLENTVFSGPYVVKSWQKGSKLVLVKNPNYYKAKDIEVKRIDFKEVREFSTQYQMYIKNQLAAILGKQGEYINKLNEGVEAKKWKVLDKNAPVTFYIKLNLEKARILKNPKVRLALSLSINRQDLTQKIMKNHIPAYAFVAPGIMVGDINYRKAVPQPLKDMNKQNLKELLIEGLKELELEPNPSKYSVKFLIEGSKTDQRTEAEFLKASWEKALGINIIIEYAADISDFNQKEQSGNFDMAYTAWGADFNSPLTFLELFSTYSGHNSGHYEDPKIDLLLKEINQEADLLKRVELYKQIEYIITVQNPALIPLCYKQKHLFYKNYIKNLQLVNFGGRYQLRFLKLEK